MLAFQGYYDGTNIQPLEEIKVKRNQRVIITILDDFLEPEAVHVKSIRGILSEYANPALIEKEEVWAIERSLQ